MCVVCLSVRIFDSFLVKYARNTVSSVLVQFLDCFISCSEELLQKQLQEKEEREGHGVAKVIAISTEAQSYA